MRKYCSGSRSGSAAFLEFRQHRLQAHDAHRLGVAAMAHPGRQQGVREQPLLLRHFFDRKPLSRFRNEVPIGPLFAREIEVRFRLLLGGQRRLPGLAAAVISTEASCAKVGIVAARMSARVREKRRHIDSMS